MKKSLKIFIGWVLMLVLSVVYGEEPIDSQEPEVLSLGLQYFQKGEYEKAIPLLNKELKNHPYMSD